MIIGNFKSKADEEEKRVMAIRLLQVAVDNEAEVSKRLEGFVNQIPPPVPPQEKSIVEIEKDEAEQRKRLVDGLKDLKVRPDVIQNAIQEFMSEGNGVENLVILLRSLPAIKKKFGKINPDVVDTNYMKNIFNSVLREYKFTVGFTYGVDGKIPADEQSLQRLVPTDDKILKLRAILREMDVKAPPASEIKRLIPSLTNKLDFTDDYFRKLINTIPQLDSITKTDLIDATIKLLTNNVIISSGNLTQAINALQQAKSRDEVMRALDFFSSPLTAEQIQQLMSGVIEDELGEFDKYTGYTPPPLDEAELDVAGREELINDYNPEEVDIGGGAELADISQILETLAYLTTLDRLSLLNDQAQEWANTNILVLEEFVMRIDDYDALFSSPAKKAGYVRRIEAIVKQYKDNLEEVLETIQQNRNYIETQSSIPHTRKNVRDFLKKSGVKDATLRAITPSLWDSQQLNQSSDLYADRIKKASLNKFETNPKYNPQSEPTSRLNQTMGLGKGKKSDLGFKATRIKIGRGVSRVEEQPKYKTFGKYVVHNDQLQEQNRLNFKYPSLGQISHIKPVSVSDNYKEFILDILDSDKMNQKHYESLNPDEKTHFHRVVEGAGLVGKFKLKKLNDDIDEKEANRFEVLKGSMLAGNNNPQMIKELKGLTIKFIKGGKINKKEGEELLYYLLEL